MLSYYSPPPPSANLDYPSPIRLSFAQVLTRRLTPSHAARMLAESGCTWRRSTPAMRNRPQPAKYDDKGFDSSFLPAATILLAFLIGLSACSSVTAQTSGDKQQSQIKSPVGVASPTPTAEQELQTGTELTRQGHFRDAIPHF